MIKNEESRSAWQRDAEFSFLSPLSSHQTADVCVVGAGISGLTTAYELLREGLSVVVLERGALGEGETARTSAHLSSVLDESFIGLRHSFGEEGMRLALQSHEAAINEIERIVSREEIDCTFERVQGYLFPAAGEKASFLAEELEASRLAGFHDAQLQMEAPGPFSLGPCLRYPRQAQLHPLKYLAGLAQSVRTMGGKIFPHTCAEEIEGGKPARVTTSRGFQVVCGSIVVAANVPFNDRFTLHNKMAPYRTYVVGIRLPAQNLEPALYWDTEDPYHYLRFLNEGNSQVLLVGGEDHRTGQAGGDPDRYGKLRDWARMRLGVEGPIVSEWSGQVLEPHDGLAYIGRNPGDEENIFIATGDSGHGLTHGTIAGILLRDMVMDRPNPWEALYAPSRLNLRSLNTYLRETIHSATPYGDWLSPGDVSSIQEIPAGEGAVVREGLHKLAVFKDSFGRVHMCSAVCPHLNGIVRWNGLEKTWDCPCHGSRFDRSGHLINGPATQGLRKVVDTSIQENESVSA